MRFGIREICDVSFKALSNITIGNTEFAAGQPVLLLDTAKTSTLEGDATTVYAQGGKGNSRLLAWEGEKTLTFTVEDALISELGLALLTGAGLEQKKVVNAHVVETVVPNDKVITLSKAIAADTLTYLMYLDANNNIIETVKVGTENAPILGEDKMTLTSATALPTGTILVRADYYTATAATSTVYEITPNDFAGYYYVEASTLFRDEATGEDKPAEIIIPKVKIQSKFSFAMASTGDPSTFTFTMDAFPGKVVSDAVTVDRLKDRLCVIQVLDTSAIAG